MAAHASTFVTTVGVIPIRTTCIAVEGGALGGHGTTLNQVTIYFRFSASRITCNTRTSQMHGQSYKIYDNWPRARSHAAAR